MAKRYFTTSKSGEEVEVSRELALDLIDQGKKAMEDFEIEEDDAPAPIQQMNPQQIANVEGGQFLEQKGISPEQFAQGLGQGIQGATEGQDLSFEDVKPDSQKLAEAELKFRRDRYQNPDIPIGKPVMGEKGEFVESEVEDDMQKGLTTGEKVADVFYTRDATMGEGATAGPGGEIMGLLSFPARALGALVQQGDISNEDTKLFKGTIKELNDWAESREAQNTTADQMIDMLQNALDEQRDLPPQTIDSIQSQIDKLEDGKNSGALTTATQILGNFGLEAGSDPFVLFDISRTLLRGIKSIPRTVKGAKSMIESASADKLAIAQGAEIPNEEIIKTISDLPGKTVKEKLAYLRNVKTPSGTTQTGGAFKVKYIEDQIKNVDAVALQRELDALTDLRAASLGEVATESAMAEESIGKSAASSIKKVEARDVARDKRLYDLASNKAKEFIDRALPNTAEEFVKKSRKLQKEQQKTILNDEIKRINLDIKDAKSLQGELKENITKRLRDRKDAIMLEKESVIEKIAADASGQVGEIRKFRDKTLGDIDETLKKDVGAVKSDVDADEVAGALTGEGEFSGRGTNKGFEKSSEIGKSVVVPEAQRKEALHDMIAASKGDSFGSRDYNEIVNAIWGKVDKKAPLDEFEAALKSQNINPNLAETFRRIKLGNVQDLTASKKGITKAFDKSFGDLDDAVIEAAQNYTSKIDEIIEGNMSKEGMEILLSNRQLGGEQKAATKFLKSAMKIGDKDAKLIKGVELDNAASNLDDFFEQLAVNYVKKGKMPSAELDRLKKVFDIDAKKEVMGRVKKIKLLENAEESKKLVSSQVKQSVSDVRQSSKIGKSKAIEKADKAIKAEIQASGKSIDQVKKGIKRRIKVLEESKKPNVTKIKKLEGELDDIKTFEARDKKVLTETISDEKRAFGSKMRALKSRMKTKKAEVLENIKNVESDAIKNNKILKSKKIEDIETAYNKQSREIEKALNEHAKKESVWKDFSETVQHYATDGSFDMGITKVKNFRAKYGDKLADMIPDAGIMTLIDIKANGGIANGGKLIEAFQGVSAVGANTTQRKLKTGADIINKLYNKIMPYESRLNRAFDRMKKLDVKTAKRINKLRKKGKLTEEGRKEAFEMLMRGNPLVGADIMAQEFKFFEPLGVLDKAFILRAASSTTDEFTNRQKLAAKRLKAKLERQGKLK